MKYLRGKSWGVLLKILIAILVLVCVILVFNRKYKVSISLRVKQKEVVSGLFQVWENMKASELRNELVEIVRECIAKLEYANSADASAYSVIRDEAIDAIEFIRDLGCVLPLTSTASSSSRGMAFSYLNWYLKPYRRSIADDIGLFYYIETVANAGEVGTDVILTKNKVKDKLKKLQVIIDELLLFIKSDAWHIRRSP